MMKVASCFGSWLGSCKMLENMSADMRKQRQTIGLLVAIRSWL